MLSADLLSLHLVTFLMFFILVVYMQERFLTRDLWIQHAHKKGWGEKISGEEGRG